MLLASSTGDSLELRVVGYQYGRSPAEPVGDWDQNWLFVRGRVGSGAASWAFHQPCLTTWEARELLDWLRRAPDARGEPVEPIGFTEPNLSFHAEGGGEHTVVVVTLKGEAAPPGLTHDERWNEGTALRLPLSHAALLAAAGDWEREIAAFPVR